MKLNKKGFTLIEITAAVALLAILSTTAVISVTRYLEKSRKQAYEAMQNSAFDATQNYLQKHGTLIPNEGMEISIQTLVDEKFLPELQDPSDKNANCHSGSYVKVTKGKGKGDEAGTDKHTYLDKYTVLVKIVCKRYNEEVTFES